MGQICFIYIDIYIYVFTYIYRHLHPVSKPEKENQGRSHCGKWPDVRFGRESRGEREHVERNIYIYIHIHIYIYEYISVPSSSLEAIKGRVTWPRLRTVARRACVYVHISVYVSIRLSIYLCVYISISLSLYIYIYIRTYYIEGISRGLTQTCLSGVRRVVSVST